MPESRENRDERRAEREREAEQESRIQSAIKRIKQHDREVAAEQARREEGCVDRNVPEVRGIEWLSRVVPNAVAVR